MNKKPAPLRVVIYHPNSFGGTYDYALQIFAAWQRHPKVGECRLLLPENAPANGVGIDKILPNDLPSTRHKWMRKLHFLWRSVANPWRLWLSLRDERQTLVIFNEFDQMSAWVWGPFFAWTKPRTHTYAVILHDPDRDAYFPWPRLVHTSMQAVMQPMNLGLYHALLPERSYYASPHCQYIDVPFGLFPRHQPQETLLSMLWTWKGTDTLLVIPGNIRAEKNYDIAIQALAKVPHVRLLVAGRAANSGVDTGAYKQLATALGVSDRVFWHEKFMDDAELAAVITAADAVLLAYSRTFKSQSGMLAMSAPYRKALIASNGESALAVALQQYGLGILVEPDDADSLAAGITDWLANGLPAPPQWDAYLTRNTWPAHVNTVFAAWQQTNK